MLAIHRTYRQRGLRTVTISVDEPEKKEQVLAFLKDHHLATENYLWSADDKDPLADALDKSWQGPVPFTVLIAPGGKMLYHKTGPFDPIELRKAIVDYLGRTY